MIDTPKSAETTSVIRQRVPDLHPQTETIRFMATILGAGHPSGLQDHEYPKISTMLANPNGGFFNKEKYPECNQQ